ncbi:hypothetical protein SMA49_26540, partial [Escherichia coli]|uniref:hypothetical protein n=1 Tax=Escherichia coli TaxID=562 RepID=UPI003078B5B8
MYKYLLQSVEGIQWFGIATLLLFFPERRHAAHGQFALRRLKIHLISCFSIFWKNEIKKISARYLIVGRHLYRLEPG